MDGVSRQARIRFAELMAGPEEAVPIDEAALLISAHAFPCLDIRAELHKVDDLAATIHEATLDGLVRGLFRDLGFTGNRSDYYDPMNSYLNEVLRRRTGIPITLSILTLAVGRRIGVALEGVGMPGQFLLRDRVDADVFIDPFAGGVILDARGCRARFHAVHGDDADFSESFLTGVGAHAIIARVLANLRAIFLARNDRRSLIWVLRLRACIPCIPIEERAELAAALAADGDMVAGAAEFEALGTQLGGALGDEYRASGSRLRARLN